MLHLPANKVVKDLLEGMLGRDVELDTSVDRIAPADAVGGLIATYCDDEGTLRGLIGWSAAAGSFVGCSLGVVPAKIAREMAVDKVLRYDITENLKEICNVMASVFDHPRNPHVRMVRVYSPATSAPRELTNYLFQHHARFDCDVHVSGYGAGPMSIVST